MVLATGANAAHAPASLTFTDPTGDAVPSSAYDITSITFTTEGTYAGKGKKRSYRPTDLVITMTLAAPPSTVPGTLYEIDATTSKCGDLFVYYTPGVDGSGALFGCGSEPDATGSSSTGVDVVPTVKDKTITWKMPFSSIPREVKPGSSISEFIGFSTQVDPATGVIGPYLLTTDANYDNATGPGSYKIG